MSKQIIKVSNVSKSFGLKTILKDISLSILDNDRIGLIGDQRQLKITFNDNYFYRLSPKRFY